MLKKDKNALLRAIELSPVDPTRFRLVEEELRTSISFLGTELVFNIYTSIRLHSEFAVQYTVFTGVTGKFAWIELRGSGDFTGEYRGSFEFAMVLGTFEQWLRENVVTYLENLDTPDLWNELSNRGSFVSPSLNAEEDTQPFTEQEKVEVRQAVGDFRLLIVENFNPVEEQLTKINEKLDYLTAAVERLNHFDWKGTAINTIISVMTTLSLDTEKGRLLWTLFEQAFHQAIKLLH